jgi:hypothetical protein
MSINPGIFPVSLQQYGGTFDISPREPRLRIGWKRPLFRVPPPRLLTKRVFCQKSARHRITLIRVYQLLRGLAADDRAVGSGPTGHGLTRHARGRKLKAMFPFGSGGFGGFQTVTCTQVSVSCQNLSSSCLYDSYRRVAKTKPPKATKATNDGGWWCAPSCRAGYERR